MGQANFTEYGVGTPTTFVVTTGSLACLTANKLRRYATFSNLDGTAVYFLAMEHAAAANAGTAIQPGQSYEMNGTNLCKGTVYVIGSAGGNLAILEGT